MTTTVLPARTLKGRPNASQVVYSRVDPSAENSRLPTAGSSPPGSTLPVQQEEAGGRMCLWSACLPGVHVLLYVCTSGKFQQGQT